MRISKAQAKANHDRVVERAAALYRARGFDGVSVGEVMQAAGLTHGGFYNHFDSKEALVRAALETAFREMDAVRARARDLDDLISGYLSDAARRAPDRSCPAAALAGDVARADEARADGALKQTFGEGFERMIASIEERLPPGEDSRRRAIALLTRMAGALALARAMPDDLAAEVLDAALAACRREAAGLA